VAVAAQAWAGASALPYPLAYFNPLLGGPAQAEKVLLVGWGEGYDLAADWLNALPDAERLEVAVPGVTNFAPLFHGRTRSSPGYRTGRSDYAVIYISKAQRARYENDIERALAAGETAPAFVGTIAGLPYVWVVANPTLAPLVEALGRRVEAADVIVADGESALARAYDGPGQLVLTWGHWSEADFRKEMDERFPQDWRRAFVVRYPEHDPDAALRALEGVAIREETQPVAGGAAEITAFVRR
jgi:hypothetical protein